MAIRGKPIDECTRLQIRRRALEAHSIRQAAREAHVARNTARKYVRQK